jgi:hypothetical protein
MLLHHPNGTFSHFGGKTVGFIAFHGSIFSELGASSFPGAVQIKPFIRLLNDRIIAAPELFLALDETPAQLELYKAEDERVIRFVRHFGYCMICGAEVNLDSGEPDFPRRLVGRCSESPREHVFSFDRVTRKGYTLRGYA